MEKIEFNIPNSVRFSSDRNKLLKSLNVWLFCLIFTVCRMTCTVCSCSSVQYIDNWHNTDQQDSHMSHVLVPLSVACSSHVLSDFCVNTASSNECNNLQNIVSQIHIKSIWSIKLFYTGKWIAYTIILVYTISQQFLAQFWCSSCGCRLIHGSCHTDRVNMMAIGQWR